jgi:hypothetical protein
MNTKLCPICGEENKCATANKTDPNKCWCMEIKIPEEVLNRLEEAKTKETGGCFCRSCVEKFMK